MRKYREKYNKCLSQTLLFQQIHARLFDQSGPDAQQLISSRTYIHSDGQTESPWNAFSPIPNQFAAICGTSDTDGKQISYVISTLYEVEKVI